jgi:hypothetical protein
VGGAEGWAGSKAAGWAGGQTVGKSLQERQERANRSWFLSVKPESEGFPSALGSALFSRFELPCLRLIFQQYWV